MKYIYSILNHPFNCQKAYYSDKHSFANAVTAELIYRLKAFLLDELHSERLKV